MVVYDGVTKYGWGHSYDFASIMGHPRLDSVGLIIYDDIHTIFGTLVLYYRFIRTMPTLPRNG